MQFCQDKMNSVSENYASCISGFYGKKRSSLRYLFRQAFNSFATMPTPSGYPPHHLFKKVLFLNSSQLV
eukprot:CCRYP_020205-RC/>CCRYP_020205-RC protein AED:0.39 eAED:1.00 QI:0/-1/0/1/-1/0/1/0/68